MRAQRIPRPVWSTHPRSDRARLRLALLALGSLTWSACSSNDDVNDGRTPPPAIGGIQDTGGTGGGSGGTGAGGSGGFAVGGTSSGGDNSGGAFGGTGGIGAGGISSGGIIGAIGGFASTANDETGGDANGGTASGGDANGGTASGGEDTGGAASGGGSGGEPPDGLAIEFWHDDHLDVGGPRAPGLPQAFANVLGRVWFEGTSIDGASYRINGGPETPLPLGATNNRLAIRGDFNIEVPLEALLPYPAENRVSITATDSGGSIERDIPIFRRATEVSTPLLDIDWSALRDITELDDIAAIVDGHWNLDAEGVHVVQMGYDRLIAVGDRAWPPSYEVVAEVTLHDFRNYGGLGVAIGWQGHAGSASPRTDWPLEALGWVRYLPDGPEAQIMTFTHHEIARKAVSMVSGESYVYRVRSNRLGGGLARFSVKFWPRGESEPSEWMLERDVPERAGSVLLVAHHAEVSWKTLRVTPTP